MSDCVETVEVGTQQGVDPGRQCTPDRPVRGTVKSSLS